MSEKATYQSDWQNAFRVEIARAEEARRRGREGRARAAARRAANVILGEYLRRQGIASQPLTIQVRTRLLLERAEVGDEVRAILERMTQRILPTCTAPEEMDLIADAYRLAHLLLGAEEGAPAG